MTQVSPNPGFAQRSRGFSLAAIRKPTETCYPNQPARPGVLVFSPSCLKAVEVWDGTKSLFQLRPGFTPMCAQECSKSNFPGWPLVSLVRLESLTYKPGSYSCTRSTGRTRSPIELHSRNACQSLVQFGWLINRQPNGQPAGTRDATVWEQWQLWQFDRQYAAVVARAEWV